MKRYLQRAAFVMLLLTLNAQLSSARAQGTAFTYQGKLSSGTSAANGSYDLQFTLFATNSGGSVIAGPITNSAVGVTNGLFTTIVDLGAAFNSASNWLELAVRTNGTASFSPPLVPRQQLTPVPYAVRAENLASGLVVQNNSDGAPNIILGSPGNSVSPGVEAATIGGGVFNTAGGAIATVAGGSGNAAGGFGDTVSGGQYNIASGNLSTIVGGFLNVASGDYSTVMGLDSSATNFEAIAMGHFAVAGGQSSFAAGEQAQALHDGAFVWADSQDAVFSSTATNQFLIRANGGVGINTNNPNGAALAVNGNVSVTGGGSIMVNGQSVLTTGTTNLGISIQQTSQGSPNVIEGASVNVVSPGIYGATIGGGGFAINGYQNSVTADFGTVSGGYGNSASGIESTVGGGNFNSASGADATVGGGVLNLASGINSTVTGGYSNVASGFYATAMGVNTFATNYAATAMGQGTIAGGSVSTAMGQKTVAGGQYSFAAGNEAQALHDGAFVWADDQDPVFSSTATNQFLIRANGGVGINTNNPHGAALAVNGNVTATSFSGSGTSLAGVALTGSANTFTTDQTVLGQITAGGSVGAMTLLDRFHPVNAFGWQWRADNTGLNATRFNGGGGSQYFTISTNGLVGFGPTAPTHPLDMASGAFCSAAGAWTSVSDRNVKEDFTAISPTEVLARVAAMPITEWKYKVEPSGTEHIGPMAQDFHAAFGLNGEDDKHIASVDESGVALAAIQGLNAKVEQLQKTLDERDAAYAALNGENVAMQQKLDELQRLVQTALKRQ